MWYYRTQTKFGQPRASEFHVKHSPRTKGDGSGTPPLVPETLTNHELLPQRKKALER